VVPKNMVVEATSKSGSIVTYKVIANDLIDGTLNVTCSLNSGSTFPIGNSKVVCKAVDKARNVRTASFNIKVHDTTPPVTKIESTLSGILGKIEPNSNTSSDKISFKLSGSDNVGIDRFECKLDGREWVSFDNEAALNEYGCIYTNIGSGFHTVL